MLCNGRSLISQTQPLAHGNPHSARCVCLCDSRGGGGEWRGVSPCYLPYKRPRGRPHSPLRWGLAELRVRLFAWLVLLLSPEAWSKFHTPVTQCCLLHVSTSHWQLCYSSSGASDSASVLSTHRGDNWMVLYKFVETIEGTNKNLHNPLSREVLKNLIQKFNKMWPLCQVMFVIGAVSLHNENPHPFEPLDWNNFIEMFSTVL